MYPIDTAAFERLRTAGFGQPPRFDPGAFPDATVLQTPDGQRIMYHPTHTDPSDARTAGDYLMSDTFVEVRR